jgi:hypothetical protein
VVPAVSQEQRAAVALYFDPTDAQAEPEDLVLLYESLLLRTAQQFAVVEWESTDPPPTAAAMQSHAVREGADHWVKVTVSGSAGDYTFEVALYQAESEDPAAEVSFRREGLPRPGDRYWEQLFATLAPYSSPRVAGQDPGSRRSLLAVVVLGVPGTVVSGLTDPPLEIGPDGRADLSLAGPAFYSYEASASGYETEIGAVYVSGEMTEVDLAQHRTPSWSIDAYLTNLTFAGLGLSFRLPRLYARLGFAFYGLGFILRGDEESDADESPSGFPLTHVYISIGVPVAEPIPLLSLYADAAVFLRVVHPVGLGIWLDTVAPVGLRMAMGADLGRRRRLRPFVEYGPMIYLGDSRLMEAAAVASGDSEEGPRGYFFGEGRLDRLTIDFYGFRTGLKWFF